MCYCFTEYAEDSQKQEFMREIKLMKNLGYHANVVSLMACCTHQDPICLVVEHCSKGDLLNFLRSRRPHVSGLLPFGFSFLFFKLCVYLIELLFDTLGLAQSLCLRFTGI